MLFFELSAMSELIKIIIALFIVFLSYQFIIQPLFINPLSEIPGPFLYKLSKVFIYYDQWRETRNVKVDELHRRYGDVVQIAPNEIVLNNIDDLKNVYLKKNLTKSSFYAQFTNFDTINMFSTIPTADHIKMKKVLNKNYTKTAILSPGSREFLEDKLSNVIEYIKKVNSGDDEVPTTFTATKGHHPIEVLTLFQAMAMDVVTGYEYGTKMSSNMVLETKDRAILKSFRDNSSMWFFTTLLPGLWNYAATSEIKQSAKKTGDWIWTKFETSIQSLELKGTTNQEKLDIDNLVTTLWKVNREPKEIASEIADHVAAGHETTGTSMAYLIWQLSRPINSGIQEKIFQEVSNCDVSDLLEVVKLPFLNAVVQEITRLHAAIPGAEPRITTKDNELTVKLANGKIINLPKGTIVSAQPWSIQRKPEVFPLPDEFLPQRWLQDKDENEDEYKDRLKLMQSHMFVFGQGNRMCIGQHLALLEIKFMVAKIYAEFRTEISPDWCPVQSSEKSIKMGYSGIDRFAIGDAYIQLSDVDKMSMADMYTTTLLFGESWIEFHER